MTALTTGAQTAPPPGPQRAIPLRIIQTYDCNVSANPSPRCSSIDEFRTTIERGNETFAAAGIRHWIKSVEYVDMPLMRQREYVPYTWAAVRNELQQIFPAMPINAYDPNETKLGLHWMFAATTFWGDPTEVLVILHENPSIDKSTAQGPWGGKVVFLRYNHVGDPNVDYGYLVLPHELGHFHGLTHLDLGPNQVFFNPSTGQPYTGCDYWDQVFLPGNPPTFFASPTSAGCNASGLQQIAPNLQANYANSLSEPTLHISGQTFQPSDWQTQVVAAPTGLFHWPPGQWGFSVNLMTGWSNVPGSPSPDPNLPRHFSASQLEIISDFLYNEHPFIQKNVDFYLRSDGTLPPGASQASLSSQRPLLGKAQDDFFWWSNGERTEEFSFAKETKNLGPGYRPVAGNFDGLHGDDIFWYRPETGAATAWWSNGDGTFDTVHGYQYDPHARLFAGDFDANGMDDLFFYVPGGWADLIAYGIGNRNFLHSSETVHGTYEPFAADLDGDLDDDILWHDPLSDDVDLWWSNADSQPANVVSTSFTAELDIAIGGASATHCRRPVVGNFDDAFGDDVFWYCTGTGSERIWRSNGTQTPTKLAAFGSMPASVEGFYRPFGGDFDGDGFDDIFWDASTIGADRIWAGAADAPIVPHVEKTDIPGFFEAIAGDYDGDGDTDIFWYRDAAERWVDNFGYNASAGSWRIDSHPRMMADVNNDGRDDVVGFGISGVYVSVSTGDGFAPAAQWSPSFGDNGWDTDRHPRLLGDVDGDGKDDVVGFGNSAVWVARSTGSSFQPLTNWVNGYGYNNGWRVDRHPRHLADVNGDGRLDIVGFANPGVYVSLSTGSGFTPSVKWSHQFGYNQGWRIDRHPRRLADVDQDGKADIIGFGNAGVWVARSTGSGFAPPSIWLSEYGYSAGWRVDLHPRFVTDVNGDGRADVVGLRPGLRQELLVSLSTGTGYTTPEVWVDFGDNLDYGDLNQTLAMADLNGDGKSDAVAFSGYDDTYFALSTGYTFTKSRPWIDEFAAHGGWQVDKHPRTLADIDGDGRTDLIGFGGSGTYVWKADFCFAGDEY